MLIIEVLIGALLSLFVSILIENQRSPKLSLEIETPDPNNNLKEGMPAKIIKVLRVKLLNRKVKPFFSSWLKREAAIHCTATIQMLRFKDYSPFFETPIHARWTRSAEPLSPQIHPDTKKIVKLFDPAIYSTIMFRNCYPGIEEIIDIVARYDYEEACFIWNNDIYYKGWRNEEVKIPKGTYYVIVTISSSGEKQLGYFKLENTPGIKNFRLLNLSNEELKKLKLEG